MDTGPSIASLPEVVTIEVAATEGTNNFKITSSHEDLTSSSLYNTAENHSSQENILSANSEQNQ